VERIARSDFVGCKSARGPANDVQSIGYGIEIVLEQVGVTIERHRCGRVAEHALHGLDVGAGTDGQ
jgi:hypothetical protein